LWAPPTFLDRTDVTDVVCRPDTTGSYRYFLTVKDNYGCGFITTDSVLVTMQPLVPAFAGNDTNALANGPHQLLATGGVRYSWWPAGPLNNPNIANPLASVRLNTTFIVTVTDEAGCVGVDSVLLRAYVGPTYHCPTAFSPNGDGLNDRFRPLPVGIRSTQYFRIFNRYGEPVFETNAWEGQFLKGWDGTFRGRNMDAGTYVWVIKGIDEKGNDVLQRGTVVLVR
jgi:gliding motility-associated-like protein